MFAYKSIKCLLILALLKIRHLIVRSISLNSYMVFRNLGNLESYEEKKGKKKSNFKC